ncbi:MAG TPA: MFS transporter [Alphaproteobacteria bacterium]|nr:MFS transporter [Alphaproteobacteria bacterium]
MADVRPAQKPPPGALQSIARSMTSWRTAAVSLLSFSSGLPFGLVLIAIPDWLRTLGVDIRIIGLITLAQAPWTFKILWSPLMDRYAAPWLGRRRGWAAITQIMLCAFGLGLAGVGAHPDTPWVIVALALAIAFASASQDIAVDAYAVDVLRPEEQGVAVGARTALYRAAMYVSGGLSITLAAQLSWPLVNFGLALLYVPMLAITWKAPEPEIRASAPKSLRAAVWYPFLEVFRRSRALEILAFVASYKLADNLAGALLRPFLIDMGYSAFDRGVALATVGLAATLGGTFVGGMLTTVLGLGHSLWVFGVLQIFSNVGYIVLAQSGLNRPLMYGAMAFESLTQGMGTGAFAVLLLRLTQKRFSATQYALFSSLFGLPRLLAGPVSGVVVDAVGWRVFFWLTIAAGLPGLALLHRFAPLGVREPTLQEDIPKILPGLSTAALVVRGLGGGMVGMLVAVSTVVSLSWLRAMPTTSLGEFRVLEALIETVHPSGIGAWLQLTGIVVFGAVSGLVTAALSAARRTGQAVEADSNSD